MTTNTIIHADQDLLGRRGSDHPPIFLGDGDLDIPTSSDPAEITCPWCRRALGLLDDDPVPAEEESKVREWTVRTSVEGLLDEVTIDADAIELNDDPATISFVRDGRVVAGYQLRYVVQWVAEDAMVERDV